MGIVKSMKVTTSMAKSSRRTWARVHFALFASLSVFVLAPAGHTQEIPLRFDPAQTKIEFTLGSTLHTVEGTFKLKSGSIRYDPSTGKMSGSIVIDATSGESGNGGRDRKMHREILESDKYPDIVLAPKEGKGAFNPNGTSKLDVSGQFSLHGQKHDVTIPIDILPAGRELQIAAHLTIPYIKWGLKNPSTFILRASDKVEIEIHAMGKIAGDEGPR